MPTTTFPVGIVARHVHLSQGHVEALFGPGARLTPLSTLSQPLDFACTQSVTVRGPAGTIAAVRVIGPVRQRTAVELVSRDLQKLGIEVPSRPTAKLGGTPGCVLEGPRGTVVLGEGVLLASRHLHASPRDAEVLGLKDDDLVTVHVGGDRARVLREVLVRVRDSARLELHVDLDEANSLDLLPTTQAQLQG